MHDHDTIAAIATATGYGGIAIVRISGSEAENIAARVFRGGVLSDHLFVYGHFIDPSGNPIDEGMAVLMKGPRSYTREDVLELHCHGGMHITRQLLAACITAGARPAEPGEFTRRAYLNGRIDLAQAQAVMDMIAANSQASARSAMERLQGGLSKQIHALEDILLNEAARLEAFLDYPDEDLDDLSIQQAHEGIAPVIAMLEEAIAAAPFAQKRREGVQVAIAGAPNAGKSSLMNALLGSDRAIISPIEGTTRDTLSEPLIINGILFLLTDTAGLRETGEAIERIGVERAKESIGQADILLLCLDKTATPPADILHLFTDPRTILVINKDDLPDPNTPIPSHPKTVTISALTGQGLDTLRQTLLDVSGTTAHEDGFLTHQRDVQIASEALQCLYGANEALADQLLDCAAIDMRNALACLSQITGSTDEDLLHRIFSTYCLGK